MNRYEDPNDKDYGKIASLCTVLLIVLIAGAVLGYTFGVSHGERNAAALCGWQR